MRKYKSLVTDYEGMQGVLDTHAEQGWQLVSVSPDTWRRSEGANAGGEASPFDELNAQSGSAIEYSASYYLLVFQREEGLDLREGYAAAEEPLPLAQALSGMPSDLD